MASFFEKLIGGQTEEQEAATNSFGREKKVIKKPVKKTALKPKPQQEPEPEEIEEAASNSFGREEKETEKQAIQVQAKMETETKPERKIASQEDWPSSEEGQLAIDVYQSGEEIVVQSTIGGVKPSDLDIIIENGMVHIKGRRQKTETVEKDSYFIQECHWGAFSRQLVLPSEADPSRAEATLKDGVLTIKIPRIQREKVTKLKIKE